MQEHSLDTILRYNQNPVDHDWSVVWSTSEVVDMDTGTGRRGRQLAVGRRRIGLSSAALAACFTMHCKVAACALTGGFVLFMIVLVFAVFLLANPMRHFEVYLGQWSTSGPGRAFRVVPVFDGIGIVICVNALIRAICYSAIASITAMYVYKSVSDLRLPFTFCRDFNLKPYEGILVDLFSRQIIQNNKNFSQSNITNENTTLGNNLVSYIEEDYQFFINRSRLNHLAVRSVFLEKQITVCKELYNNTYPLLIESPPYNYFYIEAVNYRNYQDEHGFFQFNISLVISQVIVWLLIWLVLLSERLRHGRLVWNNVYPLLMTLPLVWTIIVMITAFTHLMTQKKFLKKNINFSNLDLLSTVCDAFMVALYTHSSSTGSEIILGKGLNYYSAAHADMELSVENVWHSIVIILFTCLNGGGAFACALVDYVQPVFNYSSFNFQDSSLWMIPLYSKCTLSCNYSHLLSTLIFGGLTLSYIVVAITMIKTALHTIFEYNVKLVRFEQVVVLSTILLCLSASLFFTTTGGLPLLECVDSIMNGIAMPFICLLELISLMYVYRSNDFLSDINTATEENQCGSRRVSTQWQIIPFITSVTLIIKIILAWNIEMPARYVYLSLIPLMMIVLSIPMRALRNYLVYMIKSRRS